MIAISGMPGSGKGSFIHFLQEQGIPVVRMGDMVREELARKGLDPVPGTVGKLANAMREKQGPAIWARRTLEAMDNLPNEAWNALKKGGQKDRREHLPIIIDGLRSMAELDLFRSRLPGFFLLSVHCSPKLRWQRMRLRGRSDDFQEEAQFLQRDQRELNWGIGEVIAMSDEIITNNGNQEELEEKASCFLARLMELSTITGNDPVEQG